MELVFRCALAAVLAFAAAAKLARPRAGEAGLGTFGIPRGRIRWGAFGTLVATEVALAAGVALGLELAAYAAAAFLTVLTAALAVALRRGRAGEPCGCFGARSRVSRGAVARNLAFASAFLVLPWLPEGAPAGDTWLVAGLGVALVGVGALTIAVFALAREVAELRLRLSPDSALEIAGEGPRVGERIGLVERFGLRPPARFALAVFSSETCALCRSLAPAVAAFRHDPLVAVEVFDEARDRAAWHGLRIPGSPFALVLDPDGTVLAKGTFNSFGQLESLLAAAERRSGERVGA